MVPVEPRGWPPLVWPGREVEVEVERQQHRAAVCVLSTVCRPRIVLANHLLRGLDTNRRALSSRNNRPPSRRY